MSAQPTLKVTSDFTKEFNAIIQSFKKDAVLVGIPESSSQRESAESGGTIGNAALLAIHNFGSPINNIPARPVMKIGIKKAQDAIAEQFKLAVVGVLKKGMTALEMYYERAGMIASQSIKKVINDQEGFEGPAESTLKSRKSQGFKGDRKSVV
jgi:hypothetical protein